MYPLPLIRAIGLIRRARDVWTYAVPIALVRAAVSIYHVYVERSGHETGFCTRSAPCTTIWFEKPGYITLPGMALSAFGAVIVAPLLAPGARVTRRAGQRHSPSRWRRPRRYACTTASSREWTPSSRKMPRMWLRAVSSATPSRAATSAVPRPSASSPSASC